MKLESELEEMLRHLGRVQRQVQRLVERLENPFSVRPAGSDRAVEGWFRHSLGLEGGLPPLGGRSRARGC